MRMQKNSRRLRFTCYHLNKRRGMRMSAAAVYQQRVVSLHPFIHVYPPLDKVMLLHGLIRLCPGSSPRCPLLHTEKALLHNAWHRIADRRSIQVSQDIRGM